MITNTRHTWAWLNWLKTSIYRHIKNIHILNVLILFKFLIIIFIFNESDTEFPPKKGKPLAHPKEGYAGAMQISDCAIAPASPS